VRPFAIGNRADQAIARPLAAQELIHEGRAAEAAVALRPAVEFWTSVRASRCLSMAAALSAKTA
jgi:hypothetical protein